MSNRSTGSTSSAPAPDSWDDLAKLGEYILDQLGRDRRSESLLVHWVAHTLAERMQAVSVASEPAEREAAREAASLLIARLWQARGGWPSGWPPDAVREFVDGIPRGKGGHFQEQAPAQLPPWLSTFGELDALQWEEREAWRNGALLEVGDGELRRALDAATASSQASDLDDLRWQLRHHETAAEWFASHAEDGEDIGRRADRARVLERVLNDITARRAALFELTLNDARRGIRRKPRGAVSKRPRRRHRRTTKRAT